MTTQSGRNRNCNHQMYEISSKYTPAASTAESRGEIAVAVALFAIACTTFFWLPPTSGGSGARAAAFCLFVLLVGSYLAFGTRRAVWALQAVVPAGVLRTLAGPVVLTLACTVYIVVTGPATAHHSAIARLSGYLLLPAVIAAGPAAPPRRAPVRELLVLAALWLPVELHWLPPLSAGMPAGASASRLAGLVTGLYLFLVARPLSGVGYTFVLRARDLRQALMAFGLFAIAAIPLGFATRFLAWHPAVSGATIVTPLLIYLVTAVPEEFLFRGLIQNLLSGWLGGRAALGVTAVIFGLAHLPDPRYAVLATLAGVAYGWVYAGTGKITASAVTHALVDAVWVVLLRAR